jgi:hypothetical protein
VNVKIEVINEIKVDMDLVIWMIKEIVRIIKKILKNYDIGYVMIMISIEDEARTAFVILNK